MTVVAAIDIGSNSVRLLILNAEGQQLVREMNITKLAEGVDAEGTLAEVAMQRTVRVLSEYGRQIRNSGAEKIRVAATSAARDASNRTDFFGRVEQVVGVCPELLTGQAEATLSFAGATADRSGSSGSTVVFDIGGGSTELSVGQDKPEASLSLDIGCVRISERFLHAEPPTPQQLSEASEYIRMLLRKADQELPCRGADTWLGLAGTVTSLAALDAGLKAYDPSVTHGYILRRDRVDALHQQLSHLNIEERGGLLLEAKRAGVVVGGTIILHTLLHFFGVQSIVVSEHDILDGLAASLRAT